MYKRIDELKREMTPLAESILNINNLILLGTSQQLLTVIMTREIQKYKAMHSEVKELEQMMTDLTELFSTRRKKHEQR